MAQTTNISAASSFIKPVKAWWKSGNVMQIYPSSYKDTTGTGTGDIPGIQSKIPYMKDLGIDIVWLSPIFESPLYDMGYDISDYRQVDPRYGTNDDLLSLFSALHSQGMKCLLDLVVNHTSHQHAWFKEARSSRTNPKRDWYIWRDAVIGPNGERIPPNNWKAAFEGSCWEWDEGTGQYYFHLFLAEQPDLNWENPDVRGAIYEVMRFWMDQGCDGFRMDVINLISKNTTFPDAPITDPGQFLQNGFSPNGPRVHEFLQEMHREVCEHYDMMTVGEVPGTGPQEMLLFTRPERKELQMGFTFEHVEVGLNAMHRKVVDPWPLTAFKTIINSWQVTMEQGGGWHALYIENHDQPRSISRYANDAPEWREKSGKLLALMHMTLCGTVYIYQGMVNVPNTWPLEEFKDVETQNFIKALKERGVPDVEAMQKRVFAKARDNARVPMSWDASPNAGFSTGKPWMRVNDDYKEYNAKNQMDDPKSVRSFWKMMLKLRKEHESLIYGSFTMLSNDDERIFAYTRSGVDDNGTTLHYLVVLNFTDQPVTYHIPLDAENLGNASLVVDTYGEEVAILKDQVTLRAYEGVLYQLWL
ncbi:hypothetical protein FRB94_010308 [Tulasnella sp. JGI-2019a]|nr:hypothetical protein FRB94_010308 [Tulasnella sp. JGI-2019a]